MSENKIPFLLDSSYYYKTYIFKKIGGLNAQNYHR